MEQREYILEKITNSSWRVFGVQLFQDSECKKKTGRGVPIQSSNVKNYEAEKAFDSDDLTYFETKNTKYREYLGFRFNEKTSVRCIELLQSGYVKERVEEIRVMRFEKKEEWKFVELFFMSGLGGDPIV